MKPPQKLRNTSTRSERNMRSTMPRSSKLTMLMKLEELNPYPKMKRHTIRNIALNGYWYKKWLMKGLRMMKAFHMKLRNVKPCILGQTGRGMFLHDDGSKMLIKTKRVKIVCEKNMASTRNEIDSRTTLMKQGFVPPKENITFGLSASLNRKTPVHNNLKPIDCINPMLCSVAQVPDNHLLHMASSLTERNHFKANFSPSNSSQTTSKTVGFISDLSEHCNTIFYGNGMENLSPESPRTNISALSPKGAFHTMDCMQSSPKPNQNVIFYDNELQEFANVLGSPQLWTPPSKKFVLLNHSPCLASPNGQEMVSSNIPVSSLNTHTPSLFSPSFLSIKEVLPGSD